MTKALFGCQLGDLASKRFLGSFTSSLMQGPSWVSLSRRLRKVNSGLLDLKPSQQSTNRLGDACSSCCSSFSSKNEYANQLLRTAFANPVGMTLRRSLKLSSSISLSVHSATFRISFAEFCTNSFHVRDCTHRLGPVQCGLFQASSEAKTR